MLGDPLCYFIQALFKKLLRCQDLDFTIVREVFDILCQECFTFGNYSYLILETIFYIIKRNVV